MTVPVIHDASDIAAVVERARALLTEGDVIAARMLAAAAYDQAKAAAGFAERFRAAEELKAKARRLQGDALLIEARAKVRIADDYDAAQAAGLVAKHGGDRKTKLPDGNLDPAKAEDIGLSAKDIHDARRLRDAERGAPGIVERAIAARLAAGLEPSRANLRAAVGTDSATAAERGNNLYETPPEATHAVLALEEFGPLVWEPACGRGAIARLLEAAGHEVLLSDLVDYGTATKDGELQDVCDFLETTADWPISPTRGEIAPDIVTNPPYGGVLNRFVAHALRVHRPRKMALLLNLNFLCGFDDPDRCFAMDANPPARVHVFTRRLPMMHRDGWTGLEAASRMNTAWFVWERDTEGHYAGPPVINRVDWKDLGSVSRAERKPARKPAADAAADNRDKGRAFPAGGPLSWQQHYAGGRILAMSGEIEVGALFPPHASQPSRWGWAFFLGGPGSTAAEKPAKSEVAARDALTRRWRDWLAKAGLE